VSAGAPIPNGTNDTALQEKLDVLRRQYASGDDVPCDVIAAWEAISLVAQQNNDSRQRGGDPYQMPEWLSDYLLRSAAKIGRLSVGIRPDDDRPLDENFDGWGALCGVPETEKRTPGGGKLERFRDKRADEVASALGFRTKGLNAFQRHDRASQDLANLEILADPDVMQDKALRAKFFRIIAEKNHISVPAARNRLSKARRRSR
jgi:hypothetical protein